MVIEVLIVIVTGMVAIAAAAVLGPRLGIASPLVLVVVGIVASFMPAFADVRIDPEWILAGVLPPLLYAAAVSMPTMNFRREFGAISGLSVLLVVGSSLVLGLFFMLVIPGLGYAWAVALGAVISPTDAVAVSIIRKMPVSKRVLAILDGESLLNDPTALVLLNTATTAAVATFSMWSTLGRFCYAVTVAVAIGFVVGRGNLAVRRRLTEPAVNTVVSFTVPFLASIPAELVGASGLVAAVTAGIVTGFRAPRELSSRNRLSDTQNWRTAELVLEGAVFLTMGVQMRSVVADVQADHGGVGAAVLVACGALILTVLLRAAYVAPLLALLAAQARRRVAMQPRIADFHERVSTPEGKQAALEKMSARGRSVSERQLDRFMARVSRGLATIDYLVREPLGWREGVVVVWAGMRGAVTVAAAQTLAEDTPKRPVLVLVAFTVAAVSLLLQGGTIGPIVQRLMLPADQAAAEEQSAAERDSIFALLREASESVPGAPDLTGERTQATFEAARAHRLAVIDAQRSALLDARDNGTFDADVLASALDGLDATEIDIVMRGKFATV